MFGKKRKKELDVSEKTKAKDQTGNEVIVHVMPKRFISKQPAAHKSRGTGIMILLTGAVILVVAGIALYFYYTNPGKLLENNNDAGLNTIPASNSSQNNSAQTPEAVNTDNQQTDKNGMIVNTNSGDTGGADNAATATSGHEAIIIPYGTDTGATATGAPEEEAATGTPAEATSTPPAAIYRAGIDSDGDGLTDAEEAILGTNINSRDSDSDGYTDLVEAMNLYNPDGEGSLLANDNIEQYVDNNYGYRLLYPRAWVMEKAGGAGSIIFTLASDEFIQVIIQPKPKQQSIELWYKEQLGKDYIKSEQMVYKNGWTGVRSEDGLIEYLAKPGGDTVFVLSYNPGSGGVLDYNNIFAIMIKSLEVSK